MDGLLKRIYNAVLVYEKDVLRLNLLLNLLEYNIKQNLISYN